MGNCIYCGKKAGLFKDHHQECLEKRDSGKGRIEMAVLDAIIDETSLDELSVLIDSTANDSYLTAAEKQECILKGYDRAVAKVNDDNIITKEEEAKLVIFQNHFKYTQEQLNRNKSFDLLAKSSIVRRFAAGEEAELGLPEGFVLPIIMEKDEKLLWAFANCKLFQPSTKTTFAGRSSGVSVRITSGVYYRMGAYAGEPVTTNEIKLLATGITFLTNKNIYFSSAVKSLKISYSKIISINSYLDGISIQKDGASAKPFIFTNIDGGFLQNIIAHAK